MLKTPTSLREAKRSGATKQPRILLQNIQQNLPRRRARAGFTTIEIVIVVIIAAIIFTIATSAFSTFNKSRALSGSADAVVSMLHTARSKTLASEHDYAYGIHLEADRVVLFRGSVYDPATTSNETTLLSELAAIIDISLAGGGNDITFQKLSGKTAESGTITVALVRDTNASTTITIDPTGIVERK